MQRLLYFAYGLVAYTLFLGVFTYLIGFMGNFFVPRSIDGPISDPWWLALAVNTGLILLFGLQHSIMARPTFKRWWTRYIPAPIERSTYVLLSSLALILLVWQWRPLGPVLYVIEYQPAVIALHALMVGGALAVVATTFLIDHFELVGVKQVWRHLRGTEARPHRFVTPGPYRFVRHPLYVAWLIMFWATPTMTAAHLVFALGMTAYILLAIPLEERNLQEVHPEYAGYRRRTPMLFPRFFAGRLPVPAASKPAAGLIDSESIHT